MAALAAPGAVFAAEPADGAATRNYAIPTGRLGDVLAEFAAASGVQLVFAPQLLAGLSSGGLQGQYTVQDGFARLLAGSGYEAAYAGEGRYTLRQASTGRDGVSTLPAVTVTGQAESATGPVYGYVATRSATGTKTDTPILETPQSISVVTREAMESQGTSNLANALRYTPGMGPSAYSNGDGNAFDVFTMRGFVVNNVGLLQDGMRRNGNVLDSATEPYALERIDILKGPSSTLYGQSGPSGVINLISKRPSTESHHEIEVQGGSYDRRQIATDHTGALNEDGTLSYRLTGLFRESHTYIDFNDDDRVFIAPALKWQPSAATSLTLLADYYKNKTDFYSSLPYSGTINANPLGQPSRHTNLGDPNYNYWDSSRKSIGYLFEHKFNDAVEVRQSARYGQNSLHYGYLFPSVTNGGPLPDDRTVTRQSIRRHDDTDTLTLDTNLTGRWRALGGEHTTLAGVDYIRVHSETMNARGNAPDVDLFDPVHGLPDLPPAMTLRNSDRGRSEQVGVYLQQQSKFLDRWVVTLGGRQDWSQSRTLQRVTGREVSKNDDKLTGRAGLTYLAPYGIAPYVSYIQSFEPLNGTDASGNPFKPTEGEQYEAGVKWQPEGGRTLVTLAAYHLTQQNVLTSDPANQGFQVQTGEIRSKGIEMEAATEVMRNLRVRGALTFNSSEITKSNSGQTGFRRADTPMRMASLWADYRLPVSVLGGSLQVGAGVRYVGSTFDAQNTVRNAGFTLYDAMLAYEIERWKFTLNVQNVFDKRYFSSCNNYLCNWGQPRTAMLTARYAW